MTTELMRGEKQVQLTPADDSPAEMFERLARDPNASVEKIERLMALWERGEARKAETAFNVSMSQAQAKMRPVHADATNPQTHSRYASYEALDRSLRPIYTEHGFSLSFNTGESPQADYVRVLCDVMHLGGHVKPYQVDMPADGKGAKGGDVMTKTHATGSALSYGMRYLLKLIFNVAVGEDDDDGNHASQIRSDVKAPDGFVSWWDDLQATADNGIVALESAWAKSSGEFKRHLLNTNRKGWEALKTRAAKVRA